MEEIWRTVKDYEGLYEVSNLGRVKSMPMKRKDGRILGKNIKGNNRVYYGLSKDGVLKTHTAYELVAKAFPEICGEWFEGCHIHHKDFNTLNNSADNLQVMTKEEHLELHKKSEITQEKNRAAAFERWRKRKK